MSTAPNTQASTEDTTGSAALVIRHASVLDVSAGTYSVADVVSSDGKISSVGPDAEAPPGAHEVDGTGKFIIPGLIDCHVHVVASSADFRSLTWTPASYVYAQTARIMGQMLRRGFTTVRDLSGADFGLAMAQQEGLLDGPKIHFCGHALSQTGGHGDMRLPGEDHDPNGRGCCGIGRVADGVDAVRAAARDELRKGAHHIKIMASGGVSSPTDRIDSTQYSMEEMRAAVEEAEAANRYVAAHAYTARAINRALEAGVRSIEHGNLLDDESLRLFLEKDAFLVPTLVTYWALKEEGRSFGLTEDMWAKVDSVLTSGLEAIARAHEAGVKMAYGTDLLGGMHRHQNEQFRLLGKVQPAIDAIRSATTTAAQLLGREGQIGVVAPGADADMLVLSADPLADISVLADIADHLDVLIQDGRVVSP
ncbi:imidazolonepropionase-like amidohydrolase [Arthrobacter sp. SLBN-100]|uniref:metal-dependent hydrolase family protein n=1 Tax=Arthrobacter sp. SLBN-100 TaxID=2768450 RepID=UPI001152A989|nr:amidohydrolase family protein [Arthrobacter sp. SLBN-100]TQJ69614.1 imidazolonepropionase-like amidohydrolase [Arthrobacter sp. SLBN-100]